jgi:hypothetical protein
MSDLLLKRSRDEKGNFLQLEEFLVERLKALDDAHEENYIRTIFLYIDNGVSLARKVLMIIFTKVSTKVNSIAITIAEEIRFEEREY